VKLATEPASALAATKKKPNKCLLNHTEIEHPHTDTQASCLQQMHERQTVATDVPIVSPSVSQSVTSLHSFLHHANVAECTEVLFAMDSWRHEGCMKVGEEIQFPERFIIAFTKFLSLLVQAQTTDNRMFTGIIHYGM